MTDKRDEVPADCVRAPLPPPALKPCRACGADCRIEHFEGPHIEGVATIFICANCTKFGGDCPDPHAYLNVNAWNSAQAAMTVSPSPEQSSDLVKQLRRYGHVEAADALESAQAEIARLTTALGEIREAVGRRQLPITNQVYEIADAALKESPNVG